MRIGWNAFIYHTWKERNYKKFRQKEETAEQNLEHIKMAIRYRLANLSNITADSINLRLQRTWGLHNSVLHTEWMLLYFVHFAYWVIASIVCSFYILQSLCVQSTLYTFSRFSALGWMKFNKFIQKRKGVEGLCIANCYNRVNWFITFSKGLAGSHIIHYELLPLVLN